jgi:hypothetical protein
MRILELTDALGIHREAVTVPLARKGAGSIALLPAGKLQIICPDNVVFDEWLDDLRVRLGKMDLSTLRSQ